MLRFKSQFRQVRLLEGATFGRSVLPTVTFDICCFVRLGLVPTGHRFGVLMGRVMKMTLQDS